MGSAGVSLVTYRQVIGLFQAQVATRLGPRCIHGSPSAMSYCSSCRRRALTGLLVFVLLFFVLRAGRLTTHGDVERNPGHRELRVAVLNARNILNKLGEFEHTVLKGFRLPPDVIAVTETWLSDQVPDSAVALPGYATSPF